MVSLIVCLRKEELLKTTLKLEILITFYMVSRPTHFNKNENFVITFLELLYNYEQMS